MARRANQQADLEAKLQAATTAHEERTRDLKEAQEESQPIRRERGYHVVESQQMRTQIDVCRQKIEQLKLLISAKDREVEEIEDRTKTEIAVYKQKVKHLMHTHRKDLTAIEADRVGAQEKQQQEHQNALKSLESDAQHLVGEYMTNQGHHAMQQKQQKEEYERQTSRLKESYAQKLQEIDEEHAKNMEALFEDYELQRINEIHEIQERKDHHIRRLMKSHEKAFKDMKDFYNKITQDHLSFISQYEAELQDMDVRFKEYEQRKKNYEKEISDLNRRLAEKRAENNNLHKILSTYESDKMALANSRARIQVLEHEIESLKHQHGVKEAKFKKMEQERDMLIEKFEASVHDVRQKTEFRALLLEKKVESLGEVLDRKDGQLDEMLEKAEIPEQRLEELSSSVDDLLRAKNAVIANLEYELARATKAHNDLISIYQAKMSAAGVPADELVFEPLPSDTTVAPAPHLFR
jgi:chromosome segregation ATPase